MAATVASLPSFPPRRHAAPFGRSVPLASPRLGAARRTLPISAHGGGGGGGDGGAGDAGRILDPLATPIQILGLDASAGYSYSATQLKAAFRARVKEFHPDVCKDTENADLVMRRVLEAYEILSGNQGKMVERNNIDPFDEPECEACDIFVNELLCIGCPYSCVKRAPHAFAYADDIGTARAISQGNGDNYLVQLAVGQCPRKCIYYVTPCQRTILEEVLASVSMTPHDLSEAEVMYSLTSKAMFENNRYKKPKRETKSSSDYVDWM